MNGINVVTITILLILVTIQGTIIFRDAVKKKIPNPWIWGVIGLMNIPSSAIIYLIYRKLYFKKNRS
ncbi:hypothetical protein JHL18_16420 [Clostridium sp. YIM B02505]|uniref:Uncharacterized protein n=1 Tax=Clostridium yunnanense TaxID=2800325 RepID=A0ABS1ES58_9CLOT|nr:hypothetical protein [Clostridium yunnanense]MBK1812209.1 hypothetical protein [Clostridium yunnanense]